MDTLKNWASGRVKKFGILSDILKCMRINSKKYNSLERLTILQFDQMKIKEKFEYREETEEIIGPYSSMQVVLAKGLFANWSQPIFVDFDKTFTKSLLLEIIRQLYFCGFNVVVCVGACDSSLWKRLQVSPERTWFSHPCTRENIYFFPDSLYLIRLLRNELLDSGFVLENGGFVNKTPLEALIRLKNTDLSEKHLTDRKDSLLAIQLLSHSTSMALTNYMPGENIEIAEYTAHFIEKVNNWMIIMNLSDSINTEIHFKHIYGRCLDQQNTFFDEFYELIKNLRCLQKDYEEEFQRGFLISINSIKNLFVDIKNTYSKDFILTNKLNLDSLSNLFSNLNMEEMGLPSTALNVFAHFRMILFGNVKLNTKKLVNLDNRNNHFISNEFFESTVSDDQTNLSVSTKFSLFSNPSQMTEAGIDIPCEQSKDILLYIGKIIMKKISHFYPEILKPILKSNEHNYCLPRNNSNQTVGELIQLSSTFLKILENLEIKFNQYMDDTLMNGPGVRKRLIERLKLDNPEYEGAIIEAYVNERIPIRILSLNRAIKEELDTTQ